MSEQSMDVENPTPKPQQIDVCGDGGVLKEILKKGKGTRPIEGADVKVHYVGTLLDGTKFDSSRDRGEPFSFTLGSGVITGWSKCVATMKRGELCRVTIRSDYGYGDAGSPPKIPGGATLVFEIELLSFQNEKDITKARDGGVLKRKLEEGKGYEKPKYESVCQVHIKLFNGETVYEEADKQIEVGSVASTEGLDIALEDMKKGEKSYFVIKSKYAYGETGNEALNIPPNTDLSAEITLNDFTKVEDKWSMSAEKKREVSLRRKNEGNELFGQGHYRHALKKYTKALDFIDDDMKMNDEEKKAANNEICLPCHLNSAMCHLKLKDYRKAIQSAEKALKIDGNNVKGLYRRGMAQQELGSWDEAKKDFSQCLTIEPQNKAVQQSLQKLKVMQKKYDDQEKEKYRKMFA